MRATALLTFMVVIVGCYPTPGPDKTVAGALLGAGWGAGAGAVVGNQLNDTGPGAALGAAFGAAQGVLVGAGLDVAEGNELQAHRELEALKVQAALNNSELLNLQDRLDSMGRKLRPTNVGFDVYFDPSRASLRLGSATQLERFADAVKLNPYVREIQLHGHSDDLGKGEENQRLSELRTRTVQTFLIAHGISSDRIRVFGHGAGQPRATNSSESGRQLNRRVEIVVVQ